MVIELLDLVVIALFGGAALYLFSATRVRELAITAVKRAARDGDFQLLDDSVSLQRMSLSRDGTGMWRVWRQYRFDYSYDGVQREQGAVIMLGKSLQALVVAEPDRVLH
ncbi:MAG: DUF3301 domain-containing protein [Chromatocurvus sp.]